MDKGINLGVVRYLAGNIVAVNCECFKQYTNSRIYNVAALGTNLVFLSRGAPRGHMLSHVLFLAARTLVIVMRFVVFKLFGIFVFKLINLICFEHLFALGAFLVLRPFGLTGRLGVGDPLRGCVGVRLFVAAVGLVHVAAGKERERYRKRQNEHQQGYKSSFHSLSPKYLQIYCVK